MELLLASLIAFAQDTVTLKNGDTISGKVIGVEAGVLTIETDYAKQVKIDVTKIKFLTTQGKVKVQLADGQMLEGTVRKGDEGKIILVSELTGVTNNIGWDQIKAINPPPVPPAKYKGFVSVGATIASGNTDRISVSGAAEAERKTADDRFTLRLLTNYAEERGEVTTKNTFGSLKYDYFFNPALYGYLNVELLTDHFKDIKLRTMAGGGLGYQAIDTPKVSLSFEAGAVYLNEDFRQHADDSQIAGRVSGKFLWTITDGLTFTEFWQVIPQVEDDEALFRNEAKLTLVIDCGWSAFAASILDYDSDPPQRVPRVKKADLLWLFGVQFTFQ
jgi:putative salt-induced outer membrane protein YdiY